MLVFYPISSMPGGQTVTKQVMDFLETVKAKMIESGQVETISTTTALPSTTVRSSTTNLPTIQDTEPGIKQS